MATASPRLFNREESQRRVRHPLQKVRGIIRRYVLIEGLCVAVLFLAAWFWLGLLLDYGPFYLLGFDYVWELNNAASGGTAFTIRAVLLGAIILALVGLVAYKVVFRFFREFRDDSVALLLERRFPKELGDRLITAVEMADPNLAKKYGFSQAMLDKTIDDAADRVERLPVDRVFNWGRLWRMGMLGVLATVGVFLVTAALLVAGNLIFGGASAGRVLYGFLPTSSIWFERNVLLMDSYWPRRCQLELIRYPGDASGELRVARDENRPDVQVRALKWVIADREAPDGWRALRISDLKAFNLSVDSMKVFQPHFEGGALLGARTFPNWNGWVIDLDDLDPKVPNGVIPVEWKWSGKTGDEIHGELAKPATQAKFKEKLATDSGAEEAIKQLLDWRAWTVDKLELQLKRPEVRAGLKTDNEKALEDLEKILSELAVLADEPSMQRTLRQLTVPDSVQVNHRGKTKKGIVDANRQENNKYSFSLNDLTESARFTASAEDYSTAPKQVTLVPPPTIAPLLVHREEPAYLHYRNLPEPNALKGLKQHFRHQAIPTTGPRSVISVPLGSDLTLTAHLDRDLKENTAQVVAPPKRDETGSITPQVTPAEAGPRAFTITFKNVTKVLEFDIEFRDTDGVKGQRRILIRPVDDAPPTLTEVNQASSLRPEHEADDLKPGRISEGNRLLITPDAFIWFRGLAADDRSLAKVMWKYEYAELEVVVPGDKDKEGSFVLKGDPKTLRASLAVGILQHAPGTTNPLFVPAYYATLANLAKPGAARNGSNLKTGKGERELVKFAQRYNFRGGDLPLEDIQRLLKVNPRNRIDLADLLENPTKSDAFVNGLKDDLVRQAVLLDLMELADKKGQQADFQLSGPALRGLLDQAGKDDVSRAKLVEVLRRKPENVLQNLAKHPLDFEKEFKEVGQDKIPLGGGFDVRSLLPQLKVGTGTLQPHYELRVWLYAADNNVETETPGVSPDRGPFLFKVISENELLVEILRTRRKLYTLLKDSVDTLDGRKTTFDTEVEKLKLSQPDIRLTATRTDQARKAVRETGDIAKAVLDKYIGILEEMRVNRVREQEVLDVNRKITAPLTKLLTKNAGEFDKTVGKLKDTQDGLEADIRVMENAEATKTADAKLQEVLDFQRKVTHVPNAQEAANQMRVLVKDLRLILEGMDQIEEFAQLLEQIVAIEEAQRQHHGTLMHQQRKVQRDLEELLKGGG